jgi:hypothetical protein
MQMNEWYYAEERRKNMRREAEHFRQIKSARASAPSIMDKTRTQLGHWIIELGERLTETNTAQPTTQRPQRA